MVNVDARDREICNITWFIGAEGKIDEEREVQLGHFLRIGRGIGLPGTFRRLERHLETESLKGAGGDPSARHQCSVLARLKLAWVPNFFCASCRKGSGLDFKPSTLSQ
jgi:hypothetical protein